MGAMRPVISVLLMGLCFLASSAPVAMAQWRVENQVVGDPAPSVRYGWGPGRQSFPTSAPMASEVRYARSATGTTPSEFRMNRRAAGPLAPQGAMAGVSPPGPRFSRGTVGPVGNFVTSEPGPPRSSFLAAENGSIRYAGGSPAPAAARSGAPFQSLQARPAPAGGKITQQPIDRSVQSAVPLSPPSIGSVRSGS